MYMLEGYDPQTDQWSDSYVNQGNPHDNMFDTREEAESQRRELVSIFECPDDHVRVVEVPEWWKCNCQNCRAERGE